MAVKRSVTQVCVPCGWAGQASQNEPLTPDVQRSSWEKSHAEKDTGRQVLGLCSYTELFYMLKWFPSSPSAASTRMGHTVPNDSARICFLKRADP